MFIYNRVANYLGGSPSELAPAGLTSVDWPPFLHLVLNDHNLTSPQSVQLFAALPPGLSAYHREYLVRRLIQLYGLRDAEGAQTFEAIVRVVDKRLSQTEGPTGVEAWSTQFHKVTFDAARLTSATTDSAVRKSIKRAKNLCEGLKLPTKALDFSSRVPDYSVAFSLLYSLLGLASQLPNSKARHELFGRAVEEEGTSRPSLEACLSTAADIYAKEQVSFIA
ncbi:Salicylate hydroxylase-like protein [Pseudohyphozyma bogoriensis]|nr:Salicylate hydroxylase-like protein [Pseudohyphozyma bogoriensis]